MLQPKYKIILIGDVRVGKTSFLYSATGRSQNNIQPTMGIDFMTTTLKLHSKQIKVQIWDTSNLNIITAGAQTYRSITSTYYKKAHGVILMFDISNHSTFQNIKRWNKDVEQKSSFKIEKILVGNKMDLIENQTQRQVSEEDITNFCVDNHMIYKQTSALKGTNVKETLCDIIEKIHESRMENPPENEFTSMLEANPNTTILIEPPLITEAQNNTSCFKCC